MYILFFIFFQEIVTPEVLYEEVIEVDERLLLKQDKCQLNLNCQIVTGTTGEKVYDITYNNEAPHVFIYLIFIHNIPR